MIGEPLEDKLTGRILVVEDEESVRRIIERNLVQEGYEVITAQSGEEALEKYISDKEEGKGIDVVVSDIQMPGIDGVTLVGMLKDQDPALFTVIMTGYASVEFATKSVNLGVDYFLDKPIDFITLKNRIQQYLRTKREAEKDLRTEGSIVHDLNNLLGVITGFSDIVIDDIKGLTPENVNVNKKRLLSDISEVKKAGSRMAEYLRTFMYLSRKRRGELQDQMQKPINGLADRTIEVDAATLDSTVQRIEVIYLDNEEILLDSFRRRLTQAGEGRTRVYYHNGVGYVYVVKTFVSARDALSEAERNGADIFLSDYQMPERNGLNVLGEIISCKDRFAGIRSTAVYSGNIGDELQSGASRLGIAVIRKGIEIKELEASLYNLIRKW